MPLNLDGILKESAQILRGYYEGYLGHILTNKTYFYEIVSLVKKLEDQSLSPKELKERLEAIEDSAQDANAKQEIGHLIAKIVAQWGLRIGEVDPLGHNPLMLLGGANNKESSGLLEILGFVNLICQYDILRQRDVHGQTLYYIHRNHPEILAGIWELFKGLPDGYKTNILNQWDHTHLSIFTGFLQAGFPYLSEMIAMIEAMHPELIKQYFNFYSDSNPLEIVLRSNPAYVPAILGLMLKLDSLSCHKLLQSAFVRGPSGFKRILGLASPDAMVKLIEIFQKTLIPAAKNELLSASKDFENVIIELNDFPDSVVTPLMAYIADDASLPDELLANLVSFLSKDKINANLVNFLLVFSRLTPVQQINSLQSISYKEDVVDIQGLLVETIKECPNYESVICLVNSSGNHLLMRAVALSDSSRAFSFLLDLFSTHFHHLLKPLLKASNHENESLLGLTARNPDSDLSSLLRVITTFDPLIQYKILTSLNQKAETALTIACKSQHKQYDDLLQATNDAVKVLINDYQSHHKLFKVAPASSSTEPAQLSMLPSHD